MQISPVIEDKASDQVKKEYKKIKDALNIPYLPLFFTYIGPFPEYLCYLTEQLVPIIQHDKFKSLINETDEKLTKVILASE
ncbi:hypothetical protein A2954_01855 [Candidatus Roizmanbacteria bacterium RIFCSPLOWO2_01_FULL_37_12]|uniref:Uncharacterized protein n=1 Tax=Candidatus Roizmanbacteria bacterium RIFCSPLOWO2_01_FULL_37_12 TaxID=1802056 RepID=A0A1F7I9F0_9BACT|nr:MAG: hypothetical protein A2768_01155 [Candidatus Roizmanbacteria bacterium RIFCSPHIGHO2_01_FULL_37_16]OGK24490.1 MAG: hypothetical protein A3D76_05670 [Candidatus Roizmanbacteria bacterium RIFCSPHIGHO2_02_FULL_37_9b]OGK39991.1 MAG: hypothetical protein A2954_01855 [Candidatus Roizmanbacteria bacterium RIFCSPLOWO2_01_FULL_37_12]